MVAGEAEGATTAEILAGLLMFRQLAGMYIIAIIASASGTSIVPCTRASVVGSFGFGRMYINIYLHHDNL